MFKIKKYYHPVLESRGGSGKEVYALTKAYENKLTYFYRVLKSAQIPVLGVLPATAPPIRTPPPPVGWVPGGGGGVVRCIYVATYKNKTRGPTYKNGTAHPGMGAPGRGRVPTYLIGPAPPLTIGC